MLHPHHICKKIHVFNIPGLSGFDFTLQPGHWPGRTAHGSDVDRGALDLVEVEGPRMATS